MKFTIVTGFFNIGRGEWSHYTRSIQDYLKNFDNMLRLRIDMVVFIEAENRQFVESIRNTMTMCKTTIVEIKFEELYMYKYLNKIKTIQSGTKNHPNPVAPEICQPLYNVVTCSKMDMVYQATKLVDAEYFIWMDAGYTHSTMDLSTLNYNPTQLFECKDKLNVIALRSLHDANDDPHVFFQQYIDVLIGGFFGGYRDTIEKIHIVYYNLVNEMFECNLIDDDQFYNTILAKRHPELFNLNFSTWYGGMHFK